MPKKKKTAPKPPAEIIDETTLKRGHLKKYKVIEFLGKGGFAQVYKLQSNDTGNFYAAKCVWKEHITSRSTAKKVVHEIKVHSKLQHKHIVRMERHFEDSSFVYLLLEVCENQSMMELMKRRKRLTEPEIRYYLLQLIDACAHLHRNNIIHRDLKLGNLLIDKNLQIKLADFGLAIQLQTENEKRTTICGTPNYIAPEVLNGKKNGGHSFEVDVWSLGCIMYTLLCGKPPFETSKLEKTYLKIHRTDYSFPQDLEISHQAKNVVKRMLVRKAEKRPTMEQLRSDPFFLMYTPTSLPRSALHSKPSFHRMDGEFRVPQPKRKSVVRKRRMESRDDRVVKRSSPEKSPPSYKRQMSEPKEERSSKRRVRSSSSMEGHLREIHQQMERSFKEDRGDRHRKFGEAIKTNVSAERIRSHTEAKENLAAPKVWVLCWLPCKRYGLGYVLSNNCFGVHFNDSSKIILQPDRRNYCYFERTSRGEKVKEGDISKPHPELEKKVSLLVRIFKHISTSRELPLEGEGTCIPRSGLLYVKSWQSNDKATLFRLSNKLVQVNYQTDNSELLVCPIRKTLTYTDAKKTKITIPLQEIKTNHPEIRKKLNFARQMLS